MAPTLVDFSAFLRSCRTEIDGRAVVAIHPSVITVGDIPAMLADPDHVGPLRAAYAALTTFDKAPAHDKPTCLICDLPMTDGIGAFFTLEPTQQKAGGEYSYMALGVCYTCSDKPREQIIEQGGQVIYDILMEAQQQLLERKQND